MDWEVMRLVTQRIASLEEIETRWSLEDVWDAHVVLDAIDHANAKASRPRKGRK